MSLDQVVLSPGLHRLQGGRLIVDAGEDDDGDGDPRHGLARAHHRFDAVRVWKAEIQQHHVDRTPAQHIEPLRQSLGVKQLHPSGALGDELGE